MVGRSCRTRGAERGPHRRCGTWCRSSLSGRADALYVVNDALGSFLLRANELIDQVPMSACVQKSPKSNKPENLAKVTFGLLCRCVAFSTPLRRRVIDFGPSPRCAKRISGSENFRAPPHKTFVTICPKIEHYRPDRPSGFVPTGDIKAEGTATGGAT